MQKLFLGTQNLLNREISRFSASLFLAATLAVLAGCGSGQAPAGPAAPPTVDPLTGPAVASIQLLVGNTQIDSSGTKSVDLTAVVLSATKEVLPGKSVSFSAPALPETAYIDSRSGSGVSDASGVVTAKLNLGGNKLPRDIAISATAESATSSNSVRVTGTTLTVSGNTSLAFNNTTTLVYTLKDSAANGIAGITLSLQSAAGNFICVKASAGASCTPSAATITGTTDSSGQLLADVKAAQTNTSDTITATVSGLTDMASLTTDLTITSATFEFKQPTLAAGNTTIDIPISPSTQDVQIQWVNLASPVAAGTQVNFSTTRGTITNLTPDCSAAAATAVTDAAGLACARISSLLAGPAIITAAGTPAVTSPSASLGNVVFVSRSAANVTVQAVPGTIAVTTDPTTQTNNVSQITAVVRDANANLVKNAGITFTLTDKTGGFLSSGTARTDLTGSASVKYTAGSISSPANGVTVRATVTDITGAGALSPTISSGVAGFPDAALTVANQPLLVRLGTDNQVGGTNPNNQKVYSAVVTDASGNASIGTTVRFALRPGRYAKGYFAKGADAWVQVFTTPNPYTLGNTQCANEDVNFNGILDTGEDINGNGSLEPGGVATVTPSAVTDANGIALATITYPKDHSYWTEVTLEARTGVVGNDPPTTQTFFLPGPAEDYNSVDVPPPGQLSPFGTGMFCTDTN